MSDEITAICIKCDAGFTEAEIENADACPKCGTKSVPLSPKNEVQIKINTQELRIILHWTEGYAKQIDKAHKEDPGHESMTESVNKIAAKIEGQLEPEQWVPLTLSRELLDLKEELKGATILSLDSDGTVTQI